MPITIGTNIASLLAERQLAQTSNVLGRVFERLSSGQRINRASDDAAGLAIADSLKAEARILDQGVRNLNDGISALNIVEESLTQLSNINVRLRELAEQAANGVYHLSQRRVLNTEADALVEEWNRIVETTEFNGIKLLQDTGSSVVLQAGCGSNAMLGIDSGQELSEVVGDGTFGESTTIAESGFEYGDFGGDAALVSDFNGDGNADLTTFSFDLEGGTGVAEVRLGHGDGTFSSAVTTAISTGWFDNVQVGDINGDQKLDFVGIYDSKLYVYLGKGDGSFESSQSIACATSGGYALGDLNDDGRLDLVYEPVEKTVGVLFAQADGTFSGGATYSAGIAESGYLLGFTIGDADGDGDNDAIVAGGEDFTTGVLQLLRNNGQGVLGAGEEMARTTDLFLFNDVRAEDYNHDGNLDFVAWNNLGGAVFINSGDGKLTRTDTLTDQYSGGGDFNGDGIPDLLVYNEVYLGNGDGTFSRASSIPFDPNIPYQEPTDINNDGALDILKYVKADGTFKLSLGGTRTTVSLTPLDLFTAASARSALDKLGEIAARVALEQGAVGAFRSRVETALSVLSSGSENMTAAESRIRDTDVAAEAANLVRTQILQQTSAAVLAQANQQPALALQLLE